MAHVTIVSNRLPVSVKKTDGKLEFSPSVGGLATSLASYTKDRNNKWVGWPGIVSEDLSDQDKETIGKELAKHNCYPVFLTRKQVEGFYNNYSNAVLWPLFHNMPIGIKELGSHWDIYRKVNKLFAEIVISLSTPESTIWIHDYQLFLLPEMLRRERPYDLIGFFLHIPFPAKSVFKKLPQAKSLLKGMLGADLIGFHTDVYAQDFLESVEQLHIGAAAHGEVILEDRVVRVTDFPLGIDYTKFSQAGKQALVQQHVHNNRKKYGRRRKIILTVDRLDPTKGLVERLKAYQELLQNNRRLRKKVVMVMLAIPTRADIEAYKRLKTQVEQLVQDINAQFGKRRWQPVHYMYTTVGFAELAALYRVADIAFIAPIKDGMNLVAKEYVASRPDKRGVLILSETAGAAQELSDALLVNPSLPNSLVEGLTSALTMRPKELKKRLTDMQRQLTANTIHHWKHEFMSSLQASGLKMQPRAKQLKGLELKRMIYNFTLAQNPTILLDYDGVLASFRNKPSTAQPSDRLIKLLAKLADKTDGGILIISGRSRQELEPWLADKRLTLAAEHGAIIKSGKGPWRKVIDVPTNWKKTILPILQKYAAKTPGAFVEEKESSLVWHHRAASPFYAQKYSLILNRTLKPLLNSMGLAMYRGNMIIEIKSPYANKGVAASRWLDKKHDFILAIGDDYTDEDMFAALPDSTYTVKVGRGKTLARFRVNSVNEVHKILEELARIKK